MTASKEPTRPTSQHRMSLNSMTSTSANRQNTSRAHSHSVSLGTQNSSHRINRRKSSASVNGVTLAALAAVAQEASQPAGLGIHTGGNGPGVANRDGHGAAQDRNGSSALVDGPPLSSMASAVRASNKARTRRASEGSRLVKERTKSNAGELKCETCGKGYKHGSCLTKHLWEHTPEWSLTSKLLISKHQQVQLLEAASVLVQMNQDGSPSMKPADAADASDMSSQSPAASGSSNAVDDDSSSRTSTPSQDEGSSGAKPSQINRPLRRQDSYSSKYSQSYQSADGASFPSSVPNDTGDFASYHHWNTNSRPSTSGSQSYAEEQADITAAAEGLLSCSLGTPQHRPVSGQSDIPPVPPLPARYAKQNTESTYQQYRNVSDVEMSDDDGVFGRMDK